MSWTDERVETLKRMWNEGQSASQIAKELGGVTRNAVIGKVHRLGLSNRVADAPAVEAAPAAAAPAAPPKASPIRPAPKAAEPDFDLPAEEDELEEFESPAAEDEVEDEAFIAPEDEEDDIPGAAIRRAIIPAGQPLPPQPSNTEVSAEALAKVSEAEKRSRKLSLMDLTERTCKWPIGDPATPNFWFCGSPVQQGKPYCEAHVGLAFQPMSARRDRRR